MVRADNGIKKLHLVEIQKHLLDYHKLGARFSSKTSHERKTTKKSLPLKLIFSLNVRALLRSLD